MARLFWWPSRWRPVPASATRPGPRRRGRLVRLDQAGSAGRRYPGAPPPQSSVRSALLLSTLALAASGCATVVRGSTQPVTVVADRDSAFVFVDGRPAGAAPVRLEMGRWRDHAVEVARPGYRLAQDTVARWLNPAVAFGSLYGGSVGSLGVDVSSGAVYDLRPSVVSVRLVPDSVGVDAAAVARRVREAREATEAGAVWAEPPRQRRPPPWVTVQVAVGPYAGGVPGDPDDRAGALGGSLLVGVRGRTFTARLSGTVSAGFLFDNSEQWEVAALVGAAREFDGGRFRVGLAAGPGVAGGQGNSSCILCTSPRDPRPIPTRLGLSVLADAYAFPSPHVGLGVHVPVHVGGDRVVRGVMVGTKLEL